MTPQAFSIENATEIIPDARRRVLASEARKFADGGLPVRLRFKTGTTYFDSVIKEHEKIVWRDAYFKRLARLRRIKQ